MFLLPPASLAGAVPGSPVIVDGAEGRHAVAVHRLRVGERVLVCDGAGTRADVEVTGLDRHTLLARVIDVEVSCAPEPRFILVQALAKGDRDESAVEAATELGVDVVVPWQAARSVVQWREDRAARGRDRWEAVAVAATKQSRRFRVPQVRPLARTADVLAMVKAASLGLALHEAGRETLASIDLPTAGEVVLIVGPEGGLDDTELAGFAAAGAHTVRLGPEVLRTSTAGPAALAVLNSRGRWA